MLYKENLVLDHDYTKGNVKDISGNGNDGTINTGEIFIRAINGYGAKASNNSATITISDSASLDLDAFTFGIYAELPLSIDDVRYILDRSSGASVDLQIYFSAANTIAINDGTNVRTITVNNTALKSVKTLIITKASGASTPKLYIDSIYHGDFSDTIDIATNAQDITLFSEDSGANYLNFPVYSVFLYNDEKTSTEVGLIHRDIITRKTIFNPITPTNSTPTIGPIVNGSGWNMEIKGGLLIDQSSDANHGTPSNNVSGITTPWGVSGLRFTRANQSQIDCGTDSSLDITTESFGWMGWIKFIDVVNQQFIITRGLFETDGYYVQLNSGKLGLVTNQSSASQTTESSASLLANIWYHLGIFSESGGNNYIYINTAQDNSDTRTDPTTSARNFYMGRDDNDFSTLALDAETAEFIFKKGITKNEFEALLKQNYSNVGSKPSLDNTLDSSYVYQAARTGLLDGTPWESKSGTHKISHETINTLGDHNIIECVSAGVIAIPLRYPGGTYEFYFNKADASEMNIRFISSSDQFASSNGYQIQLDTDEAVDLEEVASGTPTALMTSAASVITAGSWQKLKITRNYTGLFTVYIDDVAVTAATGSNPVTDVTYTSNKYILIDMDAGDKAALITHKYGI